MACLSEPFKPPSTWHFNLDTCISLASEIDTPKVIKVNVISVNFIMKVYSCFLVVFSVSAKHKFRDLISIIVFVFKNKSAVTTFFAISNQRMVKLETTLSSLPTISTSTTPTTPAYLRKLDIFLN